MRCSYCNLVWWSLTYATLWLSGACGTPSPAQSATRQSATPSPGAGALPSAPSSANAPTLLTPVGGPPTAGAASTPSECTDADEDGYVPANADRARTCKGESAFPPMPGDCNDTQPDIHSLEIETCDAIDEDCDNQVDEGLQCNVAYEPVAVPESAFFATVKVFSGSDGVVFLYQSTAEQLMRLAPDGATASLHAIPDSQPAPIFQIDSERKALYVSTYTAADGGVGQPTVVRLHSETGQQEWSTALQVAGTVSALRLGPNGSIHVAGFDQNFWARLDPSGEVESLEEFDAIGIRDLAIAPDGARAVIARFGAYQSGPSRLGPCEVTRNADEFAAFAMYIDPDGACGWIKPVVPGFRTGHDRELTHVAFAADGGVVIAGSPAIGSDLPGVLAAVPRGPETMAWTKQVLLATIERTGALRWVKTVPNAEPDNYVQALLVTPGSVVAGLQLAKFHFGGYSNSAGYVLSLDPSTGQQRWLRDFILPNVSSREQRFQISSIARAADGSLYMVAGDTQVLRVTSPTP